MSESNIPHLDSGKYPPLNLPNVFLRIRAGKTPDEKHQVWDALRGKWLVLTPEEWVRQHFIAFLVSRGVDPHRMVQEQQLTVHRLRRRADIVVYSRTAQPQLIVECKAATVELTQEVFDQVAHYNIPLGVPYLVVTNGLSHYCCEIDHAAKTCRFLPEIPEL